MMIELGPGTAPHPRMDVGIDIYTPINAPKRSATRLPWKAGAGRWPVGARTVASNSVDEIYASHVLEHIDRGQPLIDVMTEAWRVLRPGGTFTMRYPLVGWTEADGTAHPVAGWMAYADPTHVSYWWLPEALHYFCLGNSIPAAEYGYPTWAPLGPRINEQQITNELEASEVRRPPVGHTWWGVRRGWEGVARIAKPVDA
jgi:SAM-dependent methyltransferase